MFLNFHISSDLHNRILPRISLFIPFNAPRTAGDIHFIMFMSIGPCKSIRNQQDVPCLRSDYGVFCSLQRLHDHHVDCSKVVHSVIVLKNSLSNFSLP